ncbi:MAG: GNAT family N-acetyltransferase [Phyllobacteriaceae bacterium]|nr:GNAT family N-acetyltransferase [Phyllobacteriaceae bacterium]
MAQIVLENEPEAETRAAILEGLIAHNAAGTGGEYALPRPISLSVRDETTGKALGGLTARISYSRMFIELLYIPPEQRGTGIGRQLMEKAEDVAREAGCIGIWIDTFSFQAPEFYRKLGYVEFGVLNDYPPGHSRHFLHKTLS